MRRPKTLHPRRVPRCGPSPCAASCPATIRLTHSDLSVSPGIDFETHIVAKVHAADKLREALGARGCTPGLLNIGSVNNACLAHCDGL